MKVRLKVLRDKLSGNFWLVPSVMTFAAILLAMAAVALDDSEHGAWLRRGAWLDRLQVENARLIVSTIAGSMITVTSLVFSLTLIALTLASQQLGPRLLSVFMRDRITQVVLGLFVSTFVYSLLILAALSEVDDAWSTPVLSILVALLLTVVSVGFLISFIHHLASSMQADTMIARIGAELTRRVEILFPERADDISSGHDDAGRIDERPDGAAEIGAAESGYVQSVDLDALLECACVHDLKLVLHCRAGDFVCRGEAIASVSPKANVNSAVSEAVLSAVALGPTRTPVQDLEFAMGAIVEIALRALSPGVNDPYTAVTCVDRLGDTLSRVLHRGPRTGRRVDEHGELRVISPIITFDNVMDMAFNEIRQSARENVAITLRLLDTFVRLARLVRGEAAGAAIRRHAGMVERSSKRFVTEPEDLEDVARRMTRLRELLDETAPA
ncbi:MAG: DUF2254 domain-containing protein [Gammaproteobacteria bacterium]|nr:DUF2254 domain-containing protein [Gammaproteobacteria bacterium]